MDKPVQPQGETRAAKRLRRRRPRWASVYTECLGILACLLDVGARRTPCMPLAHGERSSMVEHRTVAPRAAGSIPVAHPKPRAAAHIRSGHLHARRSVTEREPWRRLCLRSVIVRSRACRSPRAPSAEGPCGKSAQSPRNARSHREGAARVRGGRCPGPQVWHAKCDRIRRLGAAGPGITCEGGTGKWNRGSRAPALFGRSSWLPARASGSAPITTALCGRWLPKQFVALTSRADAATGDR